MKFISVSRHLVLNLVLVCEVLGQASFRLQNNDSLHGISAPVYDDQGVPLAGTNYRAELWGGEAPDSLVPAFDINHNLNRLTVPFSSDGYFYSSAGFLSVPAWPPGGGGWAWLQVRAWDTRLGAMYEDVFARGIGGYGESPMFYAYGGNPLLALPEPPAPLIGLESFSLRPVPEPSTWALLALGGLGAAWAARYSCSRRRSRQPLA